MFRLGSPFLRRSGALAVTGAILATGLAACGQDGDETEDPAATESPGPGAAAADAAATWLENGLADGLIVNDEFGVAEPGATVDAIYALRAIEGHDATITEMTEAVAGEAESYVTSDGIWAGNAGKVVALTTDSDLDPTDVNGFNALEQLENRTGKTGRTSDKSDFGDFANSLGQIWAVRGLTNAGSAEAAAALDFLLMQQCEAGFLRQGFSDPGAQKQSCDESGGEPSADATALLVVVLHDLAEENEELAGAIDDAVGYLVGAQADDGSFTGGGELPANANSTGLAGWALRLAGEDDAAAKAAEWVLAHQLPECEGVLAEEAGAIAYDDTALAAAGTDGITKKTSSQWRLATAQSLPALLAAPEGASAAECPAAE